MLEAKDLFILSWEQDLNPILFISLVEFYAINATNDNVLVT